MEQNDGTPVGYGRGRPADTGALRRPLAYNTYASPEFVPTEGSNPNGLFAETSWHDPSRDFSYMASPSGDHARPQNHSVSSDSNSSVTDRKPISFSQLSPFAKEFVPRNFRPEPRVPPTENLAVGAVLGISARMWKNIKKASKTYILKRNLLATLMLSAIIINATTTTLLILGEGNALLAIHLENNGRYHSVTLASELLAYAYATSVCSPIICLLTAAIYLSGNCFQISSEEKAKNVSNKRKKVKKEIQHSFNWVYGPEEKPLEPDCTTFLTTSSSESSTSSDDSFGDGNTSIDIPLRRSATMGNLYSLHEVFQRKRSYSDFIIEQYSIPFRNLRIYSNHPVTKGEITSTSSTLSDEKEHLMDILAPNEYEPQQSRELSTTNQLVSKALEKCHKVEETPKTQNTSILNESLDTDDSAFDDSSFEISQTPFWAGDVIAVTINSPFSAECLDLVPVASPTVSYEENNYTTFKGKSNLLTDNPLYDSTTTKYQRKSSVLSSFIGRKKKDALTSNHSQEDSKFQTDRDETQTSTQTALLLSPNKVNIDRLTVSPNEPSSSKETDSISVAEKSSQSKEWPSMEVVASIKESTYSQRNHIRSLWTSIISDVKRSFSDSNLDDALLTDVLERELVTKLFQNRSFRKVLEKRLVEKTASSSSLKEDNSQDLCFS